MKEIIREASTEMRAAIIVLYIESNPTDAICDNAQNSKCAPAESMSN